MLSEPKPVQRGRPVVMNAGFSPAGRDFAARHADLTFAMVPDASAAARIVPELKAEVERRHDRKLMVFAGAHIVCAATEDAARREYERMTGELGDRDAAANAIRLLIPNSGSADFDADGMAAAAIAGFFALPLVGTPTPSSRRWPDAPTRGSTGSPSRGWITRPGSISTPGSCDPG